jgi:hypothetical protein
MIGKLTTNEGANAFLVVALSGTIAALAAKGPGRASLGRVLWGVLSNPVPRTGKPGARASLAGASERRAAA